MPKYHIWTIGCQMNKAESETLSARFEEAGYVATADAGEADLIVLNSCVVRQSAESRVVNKMHTLRRLKKARTGLMLAVTGCFVDANVTELRKKFPHINYFFKPGELPDWMGSIELSEVVPSQIPAPSADGGMALKDSLNDRSADNHSVVARSGERDNPSQSPRSTSSGQAFAKGRGTPPAPGRMAGNDSVCAYVPIIKGCNNFCSYCIVPYRRGREKSRAVADIVCEVRERVRRGVKEVTLVGQNVDSYGQDLAGKPDLADLLTELNGVAGLARIRFLTNHPKDLSARLIEAMATLDKVCPAINLPVQAGDDTILKLMRRDYTVEHYRALARRLRERVKGIALTTDIIVGFPSETDAQFENTMKLLRELRFDGVHVAAYSTRPGTIAARDLEDDVPAEEKKRRLDAVERVQADIATELNGELLGKTVEVLVEGTKNGKWKGRTRTDKLVFFKDGNDRMGWLVDVIIEKTSPWSLQGRIEATSD